MDAATLGLVRGADLILMVVDLSSDSLIEDTEAILARFMNSKTRFGRETMLDESDVGVAFHGNVGGNEQVLRTECYCAAVDVGRVHQVAIRATDDGAR